MRDRGERRFAVLPFSISCDSESTDAVETRRPKKPKSVAPPRRQEEEECSSKLERRRTNSFDPKPQISTGVHKLIRRIFSHFFVYKEEIEEDVGTEMVIGLPTDVKHVTHIGLDGSTTTNPVKGWEILNPPESICFSSISLAQLELAMAAQAHAHHVPPPDLDHPSKLAIASS